ncbi:MAG: helix-turn-helix domain-containing protein [Bacteroidia bacterium]|nr:helix-turn-helix domain-containing protein [Bacteroidia bacterium]
MRLFSQTENQVYTILAIAYDCGFNSKSTFNKYFKLYTGKTPSEYFIRQNVD